jgi:phenylpyruvate tautomerase PptA (4-oxalocrotonate tautomerase family)
MPYFSIETNQTIDQISNQELLKKTSAFIAGLLGKPEQYVMISIKPETPLIFNGIEEPTVFAQLKSIGLPKDRVYIDFKDIKGKMFGWNGKTF